jgi:predicted O-linked N-acetylglucosamine transferase (SPINDLY family)
MPVCLDSLPTVWDEYVKLGARLALDKHRLRNVRHDLCQKVARSPLMNQTAFASNMEAAYREMWRNWCAARSEPW